MNKISLLEQRINNCNKTTEKWLSIAEKQPDKESHYLDRAIKSDQLSQKLIKDLSGIDPNAFI